MKLLIYVLILLCLLAGCELILTEQEWLDMPAYRINRWRIGPYTEHRTVTNGFPIIQVKNNWTGEFCEYRLDTAQLRKDEEWWYENMSYKIKYKYIKDTICDSL